MGRGLFFNHLKDAEGHRVSFRVRHKKRLIEGVLMSWNLQQNDGLYAMVQLENKELKMFTPSDKIHDVLIKGPAPTEESLGDLAGDTG